MVAAKTPKEHIPSKRRLVGMPLGELVAAARNPKNHDIPGISMALAKFGFVNVPIIDERNGRMVAGHGRVETLRSDKAAGKTAPDGIDVRDDGEWLVPVLRGWSSRSDEEAEAYLIGDNHLSEKGGWDPYGLVDALSGLAEVGLLELTGYDVDGLDDMVAALEEIGPMETEDEDNDDEDPLARQQQQSRGLDDLKDDYEQSNQRVLVLSYPGDTYVWAVNKLSHLMTELDVETNSDAVMRLIEKAVGEPAPAVEETSP